MSGFDGFDGGRGRGRGNGRGGEPPRHEEPQIPSSLLAPRPLFLPPQPSQPKDPYPPNSYVQRKPVAGEPAQQHDKFGRQVPGRGEYDGYSRPGPLADPARYQAGEVLPATGFLGARYTERTLEADTVFHRTGAAGRPFGESYTESPAEHRGAPIRRSAKDGGQTPAEYAYATSFPKGTKVYAGKGPDGAPTVHIPGASEIEGARVLSRTPLRVAAKRDAGSATGGGAAIPQSGGAPLASDVRARMEGQLGADLSSVTVHTGADSAHAADRLGARAFTDGARVHFAPGEYAPGSKEGDRLLGHELTHVVQGQRSGVQRKADDAAQAEGAVEVSHPSDPAEREADSMGDHVAEALHGADGEVRPAGAHEPRQPAPQIAAKLRPGTVPLAPKLPGRTPFAGPAAGGAKALPPPSSSSRGALPPAAPAGSPAAMDAHEKSGIDARIGAEQKLIQRAGSLAQLGAAVGGAVIKGDADRKLMNTERSAKRARDYFDQLATTAQDATLRAAAQAARHRFVDERYGKALAGQRGGLLSAIDKMKGKRDSSDPKDKFTDVNYSDAQWDATRASDQSVFLPENLTVQDAHESMVNAQKHGGLCKLFGLGAMYRTMNRDLELMWRQSYGNDGLAARGAWIEASKSQQRPAIVPPKLGPGLTARRFPTDLAAAFTQPLTGAVGFHDDYTNLRTIKQACADFGLVEREYEGGGFVLELPGGKLQDAIHATGRPPVEVIGKPSLFSSLFFAEFNYIVEDRLANTTAVNKKTNSGVPDPKGKRELAVIQLPLSSLLGSSPRFLP